MSDFLEEYLLSDSHNWCIRRHIVPRMLQAIINYDKPEEEDYLKAILGEMYVKSNLVYQLHSKGFRWNSILKPMTYRIEHKYKSYGNKKGVDIYIKLADKDGHIYRCMIEVYNWMNYHYFLPYIKGRISEKLKGKNGYYHAICMNRNNIVHAKDVCKELGITIIPINEQITEEMVMSYISNNIRKFTKRELRVISRGFRYIL